MFDFFCLYFLIQYYWIPTAKSNRTFECVLFKQTHIIALAFRIFPYLILKENKQTKHTSFLYIHISALPFLLLFHKHLLLYQHCLSPKNNTTKPSQSKLNKNKMGSSSRFVFITSSEFILNWQYNLAANFICQLLINYWIDYVRNELNIIKYF